MIPSSSRSNVIPVIAIVSVTVVLWLVIGHVWGVGVGLALGAAIYLVVKGRTTHSRMAVPAYVETRTCLPLTLTIMVRFRRAVLQWIDITAAITAQRYAGHKVVTASIDQMHLLP